MDERLVGLDVRRHGRLCLLMIIAACVVDSALVITGCVSSLSAAAASGERAPRSTPRATRVLSSTPVSERLAKQTKRLVLCAVQLLSD